MFLSRVAKWGKHRYGDNLAWKYGDRKYGDSFLDARNYGDNLHGFMVTASPFLRPILSSWKYGDILM